MKKDKKYSDLEVEKKTALLAAWLEEKQAEDILALDVRGLTSATDVMMVVASKNIRHSQGLADHVLRMAKENKFECLGLEGYKSGTWILIDLNDIVLHVFSDDARRHFNLEGLWSSAKTLYSMAGAAKEEGA